MTKSRNILKPKVFWTDAQVEQLIALYPNIKTETIAKNMGVSIERIYHKAAKLGLKKTDEYMASPDACRLRRGDHAGIAHRFQKGIVPHNKGKAMPTRGRASETQFKPGAKPANWRPVGSTHINREGYIEVKVAEGMFNWRLLHQETWRTVHGEIPKGHCIVFKDGNKENCAIENLECITLQENMARNTFHQYPKEIAQLVQLRGVITRQINKRKKEQQA